MDDKARILIADDDESICRSLSLIFEKKGYETETAGTGKEALEKARKKFFNVALLDIRLPDMEGIELLTPLKEIHPDMIVIMVTGYASMDTSVRALHNGASAYIIKPLNIEEVLTRVRDALEKQYLEIENRRLLNELQRELSERKQAEEKLKHLNLVLHAIRNINQLITREKDRDNLLKTACESLIETRGYYNVWIALFDDSGRFVTSGEAGLGKDFLPMLEMLKRGKIPNCAQKSLPQSNVIVTKDPLSFCSDYPLATKYAGRGVMTVRLEHGGKVYGLLSASIPFGFIEDKEEHSLFKEVAGDISLALHSIEEEEKSKKAEEEKLKAKAFLESSLASTPDSVFLIDKEGRFSYVNPTFLNLIGYKEKDIVGKTIQEVVSMIMTPENAKIITERAKRRLKTGEPIVGAEIEILSKDGKSIPISYSAAGIRDNEANVIGEVVFLRDITERKKAEESLRESEEKYRTLATNINIGLYRNTPGPKGKFIEANPAIIKMFGFKNKYEFLAIDVSDLYQNPTDRRKFNEELLKEGFVKDKELPLKKKDGTGFIGSVSAVAAKDEKGKVLYYDGIIEDITERKRAEEALRESEERYRRIVETSFEGIWIIDAESKTTFVNNRMAEMLGYTVEEMLGKPLFTFMDDEWKGIAKAFVSRRRKGITEQHDFKFRCKDGAALWTVISATPFFDKKRRYAGSLGMLTDITQRIKAEDALRRSEFSLAEAQRIAHLGNWDWDIISDEFVGSYQFYQIFGVEPQEFGRSRYAFLSCVHPEDREAVNKSLNVAIDMKKPFSMEYRIIHPDGSEHIVHEQAEVIFDNKDRAIRMVGTAQDITEMKTLEEQLIQAEKLSSLGHLSAGIAHEINNPLGFISSNLETLGEYANNIKEFISVVDKLDKKLIKDNKKFENFFDTLNQEREKQEINYILNDLDEMVKESKDGADRIARLVRDLKRFARPEEESPHLANINELLDTSLNLVNTELKFKANIIKDLGYIPSIKCYPQQLNQVFNNLLINAAQAIKEKGQIKITTFTKDDNIHIHITDNGEGIAKKDIPKIFEPFFTTRKAGLGTGLGLSISYGIIEKHKGSIDVQSELGKGTIMIVKLPIKGIK